MNHSEIIAAKQAYRFPQRLVIVSHVVHYEFGGRLYAYAPYAREIEIWAEMFENISIAAPYREEQPPADCAPFQASNLHVIPQREIGGDTLGAKIKLAFALPAMTWDLCQAMCQGDAIHVRCPGNLGLLGAVFAPFFSKRLVAKFAGQWNATAGEPWSTRFQRSALRSSWWHGPVTVYGKWPGQPANVIPFFSSAMTDEQLVRAQPAIKKRTANQLRHVLFIGRLSRAKNVDSLLKALAQVRSEGIPVSASIVGEGPQQSALQQLSAELGLSDAVEFTGGVGSDQVIELFERSGILVLASQTEGWPKAIVEAMAFGLVAIGSDIGLIPEIVSHGRGLMVPPGDVNALAAALRSVIAEPEKYSEMRTRAAAWAGRYSIEYLGESLKALLAERWGLPLVDLENDIQNESVNLSHSNRVANSA